MNRAIDTVCTTETNSKKRQFLQLPYTLDERMWIFGWPIQLTVRFSSIWVLPMTTSLQYNMIRKLIWSSHQGCNFDWRRLAPIVGFWGRCPTCRSSPRLSTVVLAVGIISRHTSNAHYGSSPCTALLHLFLLLLINVTQWQLQWHNWQHAGPQIGNRLWWPSRFLYLFN